MAFLQELQSLHPMENRYPSLDSTQWLEYHIAAQPLSIPTSIHLCVSSYKYRRVCIPLIYTWTRCVPKYTYTWVYPPVYTWRRCGSLECRGKAISGQNTAQRRLKLKSFFVGAVIWAAEQPFSWQKYFGEQKYFGRRDIVNFSTVRSSAEKSWCRQRHRLKFWTGQNISQTSFNRWEISIKDLSKDTQLDSWTMLSRGSVWLINH